jgi:C4-dicarboxylate-specific signal transduction histidine kinase
MPEGGRCALETAADTAWDAGQGAGGFAILAVRDSGASLAPAAAARIFEPYFSQTTGAGLRLALAVVEGIVAQSGGCLRVRSDRERAGACFELRLPVAGSHSARKSEPR